jgi:hypothetical protein
MQDSEASDGVVTANIVTTITATRMGSLRTDVSPPTTHLSLILEPNNLQIMAVTKDNSGMLRRNAGFSAGECLNWKNHLLGAKLGCSTL